MILLLPNTKRRLKFYAIRSVIILVLAIIQITFFFKGVETVKKDITETRNKIAGITRLETRKELLNKEYTDVVYSLVLLDGALPSGENPTKFRQVLDDLAIRTKNSQSFAFNAELPSPSDVTGINIIPYTITLTGNLNSFIAYLNELQKLSFFIVIDSISLGGGEKNDFDTMTLRAAIYVK